MRKKQELVSPTFIEIDRSAIKHNIKELRRFAKKAEIMPVIKAEAYGHGMLGAAKILLAQGIQCFAVSDVAEGIALRDAGINKPILLLENTLSIQARQLVVNKLTPMVCTLDLALHLNIIALRMKKKIPIHIKIDTGMGRFGVWHKEALDFVKRVDALKGLNIEGIFTHFPIADTDKKYTQKQAKLFCEIVKQIKESGITPKYIHAANSAGVVGYKQSCFNLARPGLMVYGLTPDKSFKRKINLKSVMSVRSKVVFVKTVEKGRSISYGRTFIAKKKMKIATIPCGYNDGYFRTLSNKSSVLIEGRRCPILGRVTMDQIMADVSKCKNVRLGAPVTILGKQKNQELSADELARLAGTINYEIVCSFGSRLKRIFK